MIETALKLSESRLLLFGAVTVDTICMGTLAVLLANPQGIPAGTPSLLLVSLALTGPVLALAVGATAAMVPRKYSPDERARRAILAGTVLHLGVQFQAVISMLCGCGNGPNTLRNYLLHNVMILASLLLLMAPMAIYFNLRTKKRSRRNMDHQTAPPSSEL